MKRLLQFSVVFSVGVLPLVSAQSASLSQNKIVIISGSVVLLLIAALIYWNAHRHEQKSAEGSELLPPPPPFPTMEIPEEDVQEKPKHVIRIKVRQTPSVDEILQETDRGEEEEMPLAAAKDIGDVESEIERAISSVKQRQEKKRVFPSILGTKKEVSAPALRHEPLPASGVAQLILKVNEARKALLAKDAGKAKDIYVDVMKAYRQMTVEEQQQVYTIISDLYSERKAAEQAK